MYQVLGSAPEKQICMSLEHNRTSSQPFSFLAFEKNKENCILKKHLYKKTDYILCGIINEVR